MSQLLLGARLASRGILAYRRRTIQTLIMIGLGVALVILTDSFMGGFSANLMDQVLSGLGHLSVTAPGYADQREIAPIDLFVPDVDELEKSLARPSLILSASIFAPGLVSDGDTSVTVNCRGVQAFWRGEVVPSLRDASRRVEGGFLPADGSPGMLVSRRVADKLGARVGDRLMFLCSDRYGSFGVVEVPLLGIFPRGVTMAEEECLLDLGSMQSVAGLEGAATEVSIWRLEQRAGRAVLANPRQDSALLDLAAEDVRHRGLVVQRWNEISASYAGMVHFFDVYVSIMYAVFAIVAAVGMTNTVLLSVQDRFRDLGALRVVALSRAGVSWLIACESLLLGLCGAAAGAVVGGVVTFLLERTGVTLSVETEAIASYMSNMVAPRFLPGRTAVIAAVAALVPVLGSVLPITTLRRLTVREALGAV